MITHVLLNGILKLVSIRKTDKGNVARIYNPREAVPEAIFPEIAPNCYENQIDGGLFKLLDGKMVSL